MAKDGQKQKKKIARHLDHLADMQDGEPFAMIPQRLLNLWINKQFPDSKFRLLCCFLTNAAYFHCKRVYLENRFDAGTLKKYLPELIADGFLRVEERKRERGGTEKIYHVNSLHEWAPIWARDAEESSQTADPGQTGERQVADPGHAGDRDAGDRDAGDRDAGGLNNTNPNQTKENEIKGNESTAALPASGKVPSKKKLIGMFSMLYGQYAKRSVMEALVDELEEAFGKNNRTVIQGILREEYLAKEKREDLEWQSDHCAVWKRAVWERIQQSVH